jgi:hypothetical protein
MFDTNGTKIFGKNYFKKMYERDTEIHEAFFVLLKTLRF